MNKNFDGFNTLGELNSSMEEIEQMINAMLNAKKGKTTNNKEDTSENLYKKEDLGRNIEHDFKVKLMRDFIGGYIKDFTKELDTVNGMCKDDEAYKLKGEILLLIENIFSFVTEIYQEFFEDSKEIDSITARMKYHQYDCYKKAGFTSDQAFTLVSNNKKEFPLLKAFDSLPTLKNDNKDKEGCSGNCNCHK